MEAKVVIKQWRQHYNEIRPHSNLGKLMTKVGASESQEPTAHTVRFGRMVFCIVGAILLGVGGWYSYSNPHEQIPLASLILGVGLLLVWLGLALPPTIVAHFGLWLPWFTE